MDGVHSESANRPASRKRTPVQAKSINLALQGGGAHGAFTWGVLERLARGRAHRCRRHQRHQRRRHERGGLHLRLV